jgi:hypothetical protein
MKTDPSPQHSERLSSQLETTVRPDDYFLIGPCWGIRVREYTEITCAKSQGVRCQVSGKRNIKAET